VERWIVMNTVKKVAAKVVEWFFSGYPVREDFTREEIEKLLK
jgi:hypothetical protein